MVVFFFANVVCIHVGRALSSAGRVFSPLVTKGHKRQLSRRYICLVSELDLPSMCATWFCCCGGTFSSLGKTESNWWFFNYNCLLLFLFFFLGRETKIKKLQEEIARFFVNVFVCVSVDMVLSSSLQWLLLFQVMQQKKYQLVNTTRGTRRHSYFFFGAMKERVAIFQHKSLLLENCKKTNLLVPSCLLGCYLFLSLMAARKPPSSAPSSRCCLLCCRLCCCCCLLFHPFLVIDHGNVIDYFPMTPN